ncbi:MAG: hypothetical protein ACP5OB_06420 [Candidatus Ratteibacteria bacterium]
MKYILFSLHGYLELFKRRNNKTLFEYAKKENFDFFMENGFWGYVFLNNTIEKSYFNFFCSDCEFPGEGFLRALKYNINNDGNYTFFLGKFVALFDERIIETEININLNEKKQLIEEIKKSYNFDFFVFDRDIIIRISQDLPKISNYFPNEIKDRFLKDILFKEKELDEINSIMLNSSKILNQHPVNKVRMDLNEPVANFLYVYGMGKWSEKKSLSDVLKKEIFYYSETEILKGIKEFFTMNEKGDISELKNDKIYWFEFTLDYNDTPSIWVKKFEIFLKEVLGKIDDKENTRFLFIFDPFMDESFSYKNGNSLFLAVNFSGKLKKKYKIPFLLFKKFIEG